MFNTIFFWDYIYSSLRSLWNNICMFVIFDYTTGVVNWRVRIPLTGLTTPMGCCRYSNWRPKSVHIRCVIEVFGAVFVLSRYVLDFSVGVGAFAIRLSKISSFFSFSSWVVIITDPPKPKSIFVWYVSWLSAIFYGGNFWKQKGKKPYSMDFASFFFISITCL